MKKPLTTCEKTSCYFNGIIKKKHSLLQPASESPSSPSEVRKSFKPPPGAFVLPSGPSPKPRHVEEEKRSTPEGDDDKGLFEKPALKAVKHRDRKKSTDDAETGR